MMTTATTTLLDHHMLVEKVAQTHDALAPRRGLALCHLRRAGEAAQLDGHQSLAMLFTQPLEIRPFAHCGPARGDALEN